jgi:hypothetical protein
MSIQEFSTALKDKANTAAAQELTAIQQRLLRFSTSTLANRNEMLNAASILNTDSEKFRQVGEKQGRTRLVITRESAASLIKAFIPGIDPDKGLEEYLRFLNTKYGNKKAKHFEIYSDEGKNIIKKSSRTILSSVLTKDNITKATAFRGINFSHANALKHIIEFLRSLGAFAGLSDSEASTQITNLFERGHIYAQTTGRQLLSIGGISEENTVLDKLIRLSMDLDAASSTISNKPIYSELNAAIQKDFTAGSIFMNIEFQEKFSSTGIGNQDTGKITKGLQLISSLMKLLTLEYSDNKKRLIGIPKIGSVSEAAKSFDNIVKKLTKYTTQMEAVLAGYVQNPAKYVSDLKSSDSINQFIDKRVRNTMQGRKSQSVKINHSAVSVYKTQTTKVKIPKTTELVAAAKSSKQELQKLKASIISNPKFLQADAETYSLVDLQSLLDANLVEQVKQNMGTGSRRDILNLRTGRFAESVKVERLSESRAGMITAFYTYMRNPYGTFSDGGKQQYPKTRDPKLLISKSIRQIAQSRVQNRLRAVLV